MKSCRLFTPLLIIFVYQCVSGTIINIPDDYLTIQQGIDASNEGDTVLVQPGTYYENINFNRHNIVLGSLYLTTGVPSYKSTTIIDGDSSGSVVKFESGEDSSAAIIGFTIQNGYAGLGGGIYCRLSDGQICNNIIRDNIVYIYGGGIYCAASSPVIRNNIIKYNDAVG